MLVRRKRVKREGGLNGHRVREMVNKLELNLVLELR